MEMEMMVEYLVALALPLWLLVEVVAHRSPSKLAEKSFEPDWLRSRRTPRDSSTHPVKLADTRRAA